METRECIPKQTQAAHPFLLCVQEYWLHPKACRPAHGHGYTLWQHLMDGEMKAIEVPWPPMKWHDFGDKKHERDITERALGFH